MVIAAALLVSGGAFAWWQHRVAVGEGAELYLGDAPLPGRIVGFTTDLPTSATRCANCHETTAIGTRSVVEAPVDSGSRSSFGSAVDRESLTRSRSRRGGPPSRYDARSLCELLRTGVDPAQVMIVQAMPRYDASPLQCERLWAYLLTR